MSPICRRHVNKIREGLQRTDKGRSQRRKRRSGNTKIFVVSIDEARLSIDGDIRAKIELKLLWCKKEVPGRKSFFSIFGSIPSWISSASRHTIKLVSLPALRAELMCAKMPLASASLRFLLRRFRIHLSFLGMSIPKTRTAVLHFRCRDFERKAS